MVIDDGRVAPDVSRGDHPALELLAAYAEGTLAASERLTLEQHLSGCAQCRAIVADSVDFLVSEGNIVVQRGRFWTWQKVTGAVTGLAAAAALVLAVNPEWLGRSSRPDVGELVIVFATEPTRLTEGRLTGDFRYALPPQASRGGELTVPSPLTESPRTTTRIEIDPARAAELQALQERARQEVNKRRDVSLSPEVKLAAARLEAASADRRGAVGLWAVGVARLAVRDLTGAVEALARAAAADQSNAELYSDLAAAYFARGRNGGGDEDIRMALAAADRALALEPARAEALFNRALALEALRMPEAKAAWQAIAAAEKDPGWAKEAASYLKNER